MRGRHERKIGNIKRLINNRRSGEMRASSCEGADFEEDFLTQRASGKEIRWLFSPGKIRAGMRRKAGEEGERKLGWK